MLIAGSALLNIFIAASKHVTSKQSYHVINACIPPFRTTTRIAVNQNIAQTILTVYTKKVGVRLSVCS